MGNAFSSFGLAMQGADSAQMEGERIRQMRQSNDLDPQRRAALEQQSQLTGQQIETGKMGLEESRRTREADAAARASASAAAAAGKTMSGSLLDMADTEAKSGRMDRALQYRQAYKSLEEMGAKEVVHTALTDPRPGERPDLVQIMNQNERTKGVVSATLDENGILTVVKQNQKPTKIDVGITAERLGMVQAPKVHNVPAGGVGVMTQPGRPTQIIQTPKTFPEPAPHVLKSYNAEGQTVGERLVDSRTGKEIAGSGVAAETGPNVRKDLVVLNDITKGITELGDEYGKTDMTNPLNPKITLTPKGQKTALVAEQIRLANQNLAPRTIIELATKGKPMWKTENGQRSGVILYNGQEFPMITPAGKAAQTTTAAPAPAAPAASAPPVSPAPTAPPPVQAPPPKTAPAPVTGRQARANRSYDVALENSDPELKRLGATLRLGLNNLQLDFQLWQSYVARAKQLGSKGFARGGKVKKQSYGLG